MSDVDDRCAVGLRPKGIGEEMKNNKQAKPGRRFKLGSNHVKLPIPTGRRRKSRHCVFESPDKVGDLSSSGYGILGRLKGGVVLIRSSAPAALCTFSKR